MLKRWLGFAAILVFCCLSSACISIEREIFLNADGSGDMVVHFSLPDFPEDLKKTTGATPMGGQILSADDIEKFKKEVMSKLPPTVIVKETKIARQNGVISFYAIFGFKDIKDVQNALTSFGMEEMPKSPKNEWKINFDKTDGKFNYSESFFFDLGDLGKLVDEKPVKAIQPLTLPPPPAPPQKSARSKGRKTRAAKPPAMPVAEPKGEVSGVEGGVPGPPVEDAFKDLGEKIMPLLLGTVRMRFVLHTPSPITESNADIVLGNGRIAVWNCSLINFTKEKKPIEFKAKF